MESSPKFQNILTACLEYEDILFMKRVFTVCNAQQIKSHSPNLSRRKHFSDKHLKTRTKKKLSTLYIIQVR